MPRNSRPITQDNRGEDILIDWRTRAVTVVLYVVLVVALPAAISTVVYIASRGFGGQGIIIVALYMLLALAAVFKNLDYRLRASVILTASYLMAISNMFNFGITGAGPLYLLAAPILALLLTGTRAGWICTSLSAVIYGIFFFFGYTGLLADLLPFKFDALEWLTRGFTLMMLLILIVALLMRMNRFLLKALRAEQRSAAELVKTYDATLEGWAHALELRDIETAGHCHRVSEITKRLAGEASLANGELDDLHRGSLLHDIGKMGIPDSILLKPGRLSEEEFRQMQEHTTYAYDLLSHIPYLLKALDIPYCHHEKWDGSGYPRGLKGTDIPLSARIFAVVDVYDALISDRPYREAWPEEKALAYIQERSGSEFDPDVVAAFLKLAREETDSLDTV